MALRRRHHFSDPKLEEEIEAILREAADGDDLLAHMQDTDNPHSVDKGQVGLGLVDNVQQAPKAEFDAHKDAATGVHGVGASYVAKSSRQDQWPDWDDIQGKPDIPDLEDFQHHAERHQQGGADEISVAGLSGELADPQPPKEHGNESHSETFATEAYADGVAGAVASALAAHEADEGNPHNVTKAQVGLGNVPNLDTTDAVGKAHDQNTDTSLDSGGANEITAATLKSHVDNVAIHREINDEGTGATDLWSAQKIAAEIASTSGGVAPGLFWMSA